MPAAVASRILEEVRSVIQALALPALAAANVVIQPAAATRARDLPAGRFPCIVVAPHAAERVEPNAGTNLRDDVVYPVLVALVAPGHQQSSADLELHLRWREMLRRAFHNRRLGNNLCHRVVVEPLAAVDPRPWFEGSLLAGALLLFCHAREGRN